MSDSYFKHNDLSEFYVVFHTQAVSSSCTLINSAAMVLPSKLWAKRVLFGGKVALVSHSELVTSVILLLHSIYIQNMKLYAEATPMPAKVALVDPYGGVLEARAYPDDNANGFVDTYGEVFELDGEVFLVYHISSWRRL